MIKGRWGVGRPAREPPRERKPIEFSKLVFIGVSLLTLSVTVFSCALMWRTGDPSALTVLIPAAFAELGVGTAYYYNKAKAENLLKIGQNGKDEEA